MDKIYMILRNDNEIDVESLNSKYFHVEAFTDVISGLKRINEEKPKLLLIDLATSKIAGIDLIKIIRSNPKNYHTKIIITSKTYNYKYLKEAFCFGADYYIKYPFSINDVERIYLNIIDFKDYTNLEKIADGYDFDWAIGI